MAVCFLSVAIVDSADAGKKKQMAKYLKCIEQEEDACYRALDVCPEQVHKNAIGMWMTGEIEDIRDRDKIIMKRHKFCRKQHVKCMNEMLQKCLQILE